MGDLLKGLGKIPFIILAVGYCGWLAYDYHDWLNSPQSELGQRKAAIVSGKVELDALKKKLAAGEEFYKNLETLRSRIRQLTSQLDATKAILNDDIDIANFVRMITLEAKKLGVVIKGIKPDTEHKQDYYIEEPFQVNMRGAYVQLLVFFDRVAKFHQVVRVSDFSMKPTGNNLTKYVELEGAVKLVSYKYLGTTADEIINHPLMKEGAGK